MRWVEILLIVGCGVVSFKKIGRSVNLITFVKPVKGESKKRRAREARKKFMNGGVG